MEMGLIGRDHIRHFVAYSKTNLPRYLFGLNSLYIGRKFGDKLSHTHLSERSFGSVFVMDSQRPCLAITAFAGGSSGSQISAFEVAFAEMKLRFANRFVLTLNLITNKVVHENLMSEQDVFDELMRGDIYFILGHMHQGNPQWSAVLVQELLLTLRGRVGWPEGKHLTCPVLSQDKFEYINKCHMIFLPTLKIDFDNADFIEDVAQFIQSHTEDCGWVLKLPFTTNGEGLKFCKSMEEIVKMARKNARDFGHRMSYSLLQPCLKNRKEYKVCLFDGKATFVADINQRSGIGESFSKAPHSDIKFLPSRHAKFSRAFATERWPCPCCVWT